MIISVQKYFRLILSLTVVAIIASCGGDRKDPVSNSTDPNIYYSHSVFLKNGEAYSSGANANGQLGDGNNDETENKDTPVQVVGEGGNGILTGIVGVATGQTHSLAVSSLSSGGNVYAWGNNGNRQLGTSSDSPAVEPTKTVKADGSALGNITAVSAGSNFSLALDQTGNVWAWGDNSVGQLGFASPDPAHAAQLPAPLNIAKISAGGLHALAIDNTGKAYGWGKNVSGQLGFDTSITTPPGIVHKENNGAFGDELQTDSPVTDIAAGGSHSLFLRADHTVWACGYNFYGQLGTGTTDRSNKIHGAAQVLKTLNTPLTGVLAVAAGLSHSLAIIDRYTDINGQEHLRTVWGWGLNFYGQLGNPLNYLTVTPVFSPVPVQKVDGSFLEDITMIIAIGNHSLAVDGSGQLWVWGNDGYGQLGIGDIGTDTTRRYATMVPGFKPGSFSP
jgi:alpha-tubulin suppressor-like RCC1 family protein